VNHQPEAPFDDIEGAQEYTHLLLEAAQQAKQEVEAEIARVAGDAQLARRKEALQLVTFKLNKLSTHIVASRQILNDLRTLRRLLLNERKSPHQDSRQPKTASAVENDQKKPAAKNR
jgi:hypothetical protein